MSQYLASIASGQGFKIFKDIQITGLEGMESDKDPLLMNNLEVIEISPQQPDQPKFENDFWIEFLEDNINRSLTLKIIPMNDQLSNNYYIEFSYYSTTKIKFNIKCNPTVNADKHLYLIKVLNKIRNKEYRRFYVQDAQNRKVLSSFCPNLNNTYGKNDAYFLEILSKLNELYEIDLPVPLEVNQLMFSKGNHLLNIWEDLTQHEKVKKVNDLKKDLTSLRTSFISTSLISSDASISNPSLIIHKTGWLDYRLLGIAPRNPKYTFEIKNIIKNQKEIFLSLNLREFSPKELLEYLVSGVKKENIDFFKLVFKLIKDNNDYLNQEIKSTMSIKFKEPQNGIQLVEIKIEDPNPNLNKLIQMYKVENYIEMIPLLEEFKTDQATLAYAYVLNSEYEKAIGIAEECISDDIGSVAHMTRGLAYFGLKEYKKAKEAYQLGVNICTYQWFPKAKENLESFMVDNKIKENGIIRSILEILSNEKKPMNPKQKCYCGSKKMLKKCHAKI